MLQNGNTSTPLKIHTQPFYLVPNNWEIWRRELQKHQAWCKKRRQRPYTYYCSNNEESKKKNNQKSLFFMKLMMSGKTSCVEVIELNWSNRT